MSLKLWDGLKEVCTSSEKKLLQHYEDDGFEVSVVNKDRYYAYKDNGSNVLAVAHMDTVHPKWRGKFNFNKKKRRVDSIALDDRLGVYIITKILPQFDIEPDILLTTDEEIGSSTALWFDANKKYNWIFSFDRRGDDVVMYDYETVELSGMLEDHGYEVGWGTWSDICYLEHLGVSGFNFGTGYYNEHSKTCFALIDIVSMAVARFIEFFSRFKNTKFEYVPKPKSAIPATYQYDYSTGQYVRSEDDLGWNDYPDDDKIGSEYGSVMSVQEVMLFEEEHESYNHYVDYYVIDDTWMAVYCENCNEEHYFKC
jgi:hypothetical protein